MRFIFSCSGSLCLMKYSDFCVNLTKFSTILKCDTVECQNGRPNNGQLPYLAISQLGCHFGAHNSLIFP